MCECVLCVHMIGMHAHACEHAEPASLTVQRGWLAVKLQTSSRFYLPSAVITGTLHPVLSVCLMCVLGTKLRSHVHVLSLLAGPDPQPQTTERMFHFSKAFVLMRNTYKISSYECYKEDRER